MSIRWTGAGGRGLRAAGIFCMLALVGGSPAAAAAAASPAVTGRVVAAGAPQEGVVVSLRHADSGVITAVTSDARGRFLFDRDHIAPGRYALDVRAVGYVLAGGERTVQVAPRRATKLGLVLEPVRDVDTLASQLTSLEWVMSFPGSDADKDVIVRNMVNCGFCHSLERIARSTHDAAALKQVIQRMATYESDHSSHLRIQLVSAPLPLEGLRWWGRDADAIAAYFAKINLSGGRKTWDYALKTLPRPTGKATRAIVTVYTLPRQPSVIHDLDVDRDGNVWFGNTGYDFLGRLDPKTGVFTEFPAPNFLPEPKPGELPRIEGVQDIQVDPQGVVWAAIRGTKLAGFDPKLEAWSIIDLPVVWRNPFLGPVRDGERYLWATGLFAPPGGLSQRHEQAFRLDTVTRKLDKSAVLFDGLPEPEDPDHVPALNYCYMMDQDAAGRFLCTVSEGAAIARIDDAGQVRLVRAPTARSYPRRGYRDDANRFWFGQFYGDRIGVIDLNTDRITEYPVAPKYISPYYARPDGKGHVFASSTGSDRLLRLDPRTGEVVQYLMPVTYDARKVVVDRRAKITTVWLPNKNQAQLVRVEVPD